ncbi:unnamed protein product, partial [Rotaria sp. Silwood1]
MSVLFLHRVFGYRGVILFSWLARVFDRSDERSNVSSPFTISSSQPNIYEIRAQSVTYYQVLIDTRDIPYIRAQTEAVTFFGNQEQDRNLYAIPGLDYVAHEDVMPYTSTERVPLEHELFDKFFLHDPDANLQVPNFVPSEHLKSWQKRHHLWLELSDVSKDITHHIRVTVIPFYIGSRLAQDMNLHWWRYLIRIENLNPDEPVTLRERHWRIFSLSGSLETVRGKGVVGQEPRLSKEHPAFQYSSHVSLPATSGHMWGTFKMEKDDGTFIEVRIPAFNLECIIVQQEPYQQIEKIRINLHKLQLEDPADFTPNLIKELLQDGYSFDNDTSERLLQQRYSAANSKDDDDDINDNDNDEEHQPLKKKRIRRTNDNILNHNSIDVMSALNKKTRDRLARKPLYIDADPQENTSYQRFIQLLDIFNDDYECHHEQFEQTPDDHYLDLLLSEHTLDEMAILSEKLKLSTYMSRIDRMKLKRLLEILSLRIKQGIEISPILKHDINDEQINEEEERIWRDIVFERLTMCANACEISLNIMTTDNMPKEILIEHVIEHTALFIKAQLAKTIFPEYDPLYRNDNHSKDPSLTKQKRSKVTGTKCKQVQILYNKIVSLFQGITDLMPLGKYTDTIILAISSFTVSCIYVENIVDIQAHSLRILTELFSRYEHHRDSILEDLLLSIARLPTSKKSLRCYRLPSGESIQMFTALIMNLIHAPVSLGSIINLNIIDTTNELYLLNTYTTAQNLAFKFLTLFFRSCGTKQGEDDYRIVFENFLADLLVTANRPEWPASEILLTLLSRILMTNFSNHSLPINTRLQSLDYLGSVAAQLRKDTIDNDVLNSKENQDKLDQIVYKTLSSIELDEDVMEVYKTDPLRYHRSLVIYLNELSLSDQTSHYAKMFHIGQWLRDINLTVERLTQTLTRRMKSGQTELVDDDVDESMNNNNNNSKPSISIEDEIEMKKTEKFSILKMLSMPETARKQQRYTLDIEYDDICLLMRYLTSNRPFLKTFDVYLKQLAAIFQSEAGTNIRSKAMKCLCTVVEADPTILARNDIKSCVKVGLTDKSISVREAAIDLIGRYIVQKQELILQYYDVLCESSIDT